MELPQPRRQGLLGKKNKKTWKTGSDSAGYTECRAGDGGHARPPISTNILQLLAGCDCVEERKKKDKDTQALTDTTGDPLTYSPNHFIDLWA